MSGSKNAYRTMLIYGLVGGPDIGVKRFPISEGQDVPVDQFEAIGTIRKKRCSATLITDWLVLSAAHCVGDKDTYEQTVSKTTFTLHDVFPAKGAEKRQDIDIPGTVHIHPEWGKMGYLTKDIAVIRLDYPATSVAQVTPIQVDRNDVPRVGEILTIVGFGRTNCDCNGPSGLKKMAELAVKASNAETIDFDEEVHACPGDSGGPVINCAGRVVGVHSCHGGSRSQSRPIWPSYDWILRNEPPTPSTGPTCTHSIVHPCIELIMGQCYGLEQKKKEKELEPFKDCSVDVRPHFSNLDCEIEGLVADAEHEDLDIRNLKDKLNLIPLGLRKSVQMMLEQIRYERRHSQ